MKTTIYFIRLKGADWRFPANRLTYGPKECREHIEQLRKQRDPNSRRKAYNRAVFEIVRETVDQTIVGSSQPEPKSEHTRCSGMVRYPGTNFPRYHQCVRNATTTSGGKPVCTQHSPAAADKRAVKREAANKRQSNLYLARFHAKNAARNHSHNRES